MDGKITWVPLYFFEEYIKVSLLSDSKAGKRYKEFLKTCIDGKTDGEFGDLVARSIEKMEKLREKAKKGAERRWEKPAPGIPPSNAPGIPPSNAPGNADRLETNLRMLAKSFVKNRLALCASLYALISKARFAISGKVMSIP